MDIRPLGEKAVIVYFEETISYDISRKVHILYDTLKEMDIPYVYDIVPAYRSLTIHYDPLRLPFSVLKTQIEGLDLSKKSEERKGKLLKVPVLYGGKYGPDLEYVASYHNISTDDVIRYHTGRDYFVYMLGFSPGFTYLGTLHQMLETPRLKTPRKRVDAGAVGIAGRQTGIYAVPSPGGWQIIGRTYLRLFDPERNPPVLLNPGDRVRFFSVSEEEFLSHISTSSAQKAHKVTNPVFEVLDPGPLSIIVDSGRRGYGSIGLSQGGPMDYTSYLLSNYILGNGEDAPSVEILFSGFSIRTLKDTVVSLVGGQFEVFVNSDRFYSNNKFFLKKGDILKIGKRIEGARVYLSVPGGIDAPLVLGSASLDMKAGIGGIYGRPLEKGDLIPIRSSSDFTIGRELVRVPCKKDSPIVLRFIPGPDLDHFPEGIISTFSGNTYRVTQEGDRMGYRLEGPKIPHNKKGPGIISDGTVPGTIQIPGDGMPIVLTRDAQPLGGYAKIGVVISPDLDRLSQAIPNDEIRFLPVTLDEAILALKRKEVLKRELIIDRGKRFRLKVDRKVYNVEIAPSDSIV